MGKKIVAIAMGGYSSEFEISIKSGEVVYDAMDKNQFEIYKVHILKNNWHYVFPDGRKVVVNKENFGCAYNGNTIIPDVVFNTIHGTPGEDGMLASYLELINIPQTSAAFHQAALRFNKRDCLSVLKKLGINCAESIYINKGDVIDTKKIINTVGLPCFVKPNRAGSSFGISRVQTAEMLPKALLEAYKEDTEVLIESELVGTEVSVGVYKHKGEIQILNPTEIVSENDFFDYEAKYQGKSQEITPARISTKDKKTVQKVAKQIYQLLNMKGVTRTDFIIQNGVPYFIEINTTPGLSKESIIPKQLSDAQISLSHFFTMLVMDAIDNK